MTTENDVSSGAETEITAPVEAETTAPAAEQLEQTTSEQAESEEDKGQKAAKALQRRLDKRTRDFYQERAQREQLQAEIEALRQRTTAEAPEDRAPSREDVESRASQLMQERELASRVSALMTKGKAIDGFEAAASAVVEELGLVDSKGRPTPSLHALLDADSPAELIAHIGSDPDLLDSLAGLSPTRLAARLARIEDAMKAAKAPKSSNAPKPLAPVKPAASATVDIHKLDSDADWYRERQKQRPRT